MRRAPESASGFAFNGPAEMPTQVAEARDEFAPMRALLSSAVARVPVDELGGNVRTRLRDEAEQQDQDLLAVFLDACG
jgi:hypothetical protein